MLTHRQEQVVRLASLRAANVNQFDMHVADASSGRRVSDQELRTIVDEASRVARLPYQNKRWADVR
jgi:hypothetical protein